jgi:secondary thiamine-phosphate synthase enzyme
MLKGRDQPPAGLRDIGREETSMITEEAEILEIETSSGRSSQSEPQRGLRIFNRIAVWNTSERIQLINITDCINEVVSQSQIRDGMVHLHSLHTTTAIFVNEWQDALLHDVKLFLEQLICQGSAWRHNDPRFSDCERKNADSHLRAMILGQSLCLQVRNSTVLLGTWQSIIMAEFDGPRSRSLSIQVSGV